MAGLGIDTEEEIDLTTEIFGLPPFNETTSVNELLESLVHCERWHATLAWSNYARVEVIHRIATSTPADQDLRVLDDRANVAARLSAMLRLSKNAADTMLSEALAMTYRIPRIGQCLRDGLISHRDFQRLVTFTDLLDGQPYSAAADKDIALELRHSGSWATRRLRDLADRIIFRHDPDSVRRRHEKAKHDRSCGSVPLRDGMARIGIAASAEDVAIAMAAVNALADSVCARDPRNPRARRSDAAISTLQGLPFQCVCDRDDCDATTDGQDLSQQHARTVVHVICQSGTLDDGPDDADPDPHDRPDPHDHPGFLDGYGVISADHVREIAARPDTIIRPINPNPDDPLPRNLPSDPYRFSTALDAFIRARDGYCTFPGCDHPAWSADIDHVAEYDHKVPEAGGQTSAINGNVKCRLHHMLKTFGDWLDDQYIGPDGLTHTEVFTPEGLRVHGHGHTNEDLFPRLRDIKFQPPPSVKPRVPTAGNPAHTRAEPQRRRTRAADKLARRRLERRRNRQFREAMAPPGESAGSP